MEFEKFRLHQFTLATIIDMIKQDMFVVPELQRPFVWKDSQVRDLFDSLYRGYPTGYIITWKNPDVATKDGQRANGRTILIDGQQRITALMAVLCGQTVLDVNFQYRKLKLAFNPLKTQVDKMFMLQDTSKIKDKKWIPNITEVLRNNFSMFDFLNDYQKANPTVDIHGVELAIDNLRKIMQHQVGVIELDPNLSIKEVNEIFIRVNSKGTPLKQVDFVLAKLAADTKHSGLLLRKTLDYFGYLLNNPKNFATLKKDRDFVSSDYIAKLEWLTTNKDHIYLPDVEDVLQVSFMYAFGKSNFTDLVSLLGGYDTRQHIFTEEIIADTFTHLEQGICKFINQHNFEGFSEILMQAGFIASKLLSSKTYVNFAYALYLKLLEDKQLPYSQIKHCVQKWFVWTLLSQRYNSGDSTKVVKQDLQEIDKQGFNAFLASVSQEKWMKSFWDNWLPQRLQSSAVTNPLFQVFLAAQIWQKSSALFTKKIKIATLIKTSGEIHHIFPQAYLRRNGIIHKGQYNQVANYTYLVSTVNKAIEDKAPNVYFQDIKNNLAHSLLGDLESEEQFYQSLKENAIPKAIITMDYRNYDQFLDERRKLMVKLIKKYYEAL